MMKLALVLALVAAPMIGQQMPQMPNFKAPPGHTVKVESVTTRYDFSKFNREITMNLDAFIWAPSEVPKGYKETKTVKPATKAATSLWNSWETVLPAFGAPERKIAQAYTGADGGVIMYIKWGKPLPQDARKAICRVLYKADEKPAGKDTNDEILVTDDWVIVWSFPKPLSKLKEAHQKRTFDNIGRQAEAWMKANPEKAKKYQQAPGK
ncbi:MAG: hypothetical protein IPI24_03925 [Ignavibacteria bacterium]|nr:hypothetical protein [Ignavibacteria bacterium]MBK7413082.1 hypothetical protein [Ignavibacteria bacterium]MBK7576565.1 hypothetical protein [Ignavibacteria bacterium]